MNFIIHIGQQPRINEGKESKWGFLLLAPIFQKPHCHCARFRLIDHLPAAILATGPFCL